MKKISAEIRRFRWIIAAVGVLALIVSNALPKGVHTFDHIDGVWVTEARCAIPVAIALRQSLIDARYYRDQQGAYARNPRTARRPDFDPSLEALQPVLAGTMPVVFRANTQREIERAALHRSAAPATT